MTSAVLEQFTQMDPLPGGSSFEGAYVYAGQNPAMFIDPSGLRRAQSAKGKKTQFIPFAKKLTCEDATIPALCRFLLGDPPANAKIGIVFPVGGLGDAESFPPNLATEMESMRVGVPGGISRSSAIAVGELQIDGSATRIIKRAVSGEATRPGFVDLVDEPAFKTSIAKAGQGNLRDFDAERKLLEAFSLELRNAGSQSGGVPNELALKNPIRPCAPSGYPEHDAAQRAWALARGALVDQSTPGRGLCMDVYKPSTGEIWEIKSSSTLGIKVAVLGAQAQVDGYVADTPGSQTGGDHGAVVVPWFGGELVAQSYPLAVGPKDGFGVLAHSDGAPRS